MGIKNKRGFATADMFKYIFYAMFIGIFLGIVVVIFYWVDFGLGQNVEIGQVNLQDINNNTFGKINLAVHNNADTLGIIIIVGMALSLIMNAYYNGQRTALFFIVDFFFIVFAFILAVYVSQAYSYIVNATTYLDVYINDIPDVSKFILNLPQIVSILGVIIMVVTYGLANNKRGEPNVAGY